MTDITKYKSIKDVPPDEVLAKSDDGKTLVLKDGTKVSDELIKKANTEARARDAAQSAASDSGIKLDDPDFVKKVEEIATAAAQKVINAANAKK